MKIVSAGGGSGGHVTPVLAVINELKQRDPQLESWFVCDRGYSAQAERIMSAASVPTPVKTIAAGKLRRYHGMSFWQHVTDAPTVLKNLRDTLLIAAGFVQSLFFLLKVKPDVVFTKGGFVCVPVGLAARLLRIPLVIHDSDTHPGLTNRLLARFAAAIGTGAPLSFYNYPARISHYVGIPVSTAYQPADVADKTRLKRQLGYNEILPLVLVTGGGTGALRINIAAAANAERLVKKAQVVHLTGAGKAVAVRAQAKNLPNYTVLEFVDKEMPQLVRAADVVVTRAGMTTLLELSSAAKPTIIIPSPLLSGGHQLKNAAIWAEHNAALVLDEAAIEAKPELFGDAVLKLLVDEKEQKRLSRAIHELATPNAAAHMAELVLQHAKQGRGGV